MPFLGVLSLPGRADWLLPAAGLFLIGLVLVVWAYHKAPAIRWVRLTCLLLKLVGVLALLLCLLEPLWSGQRAKPGANLFLILGDNSQGMQIHDRDQLRSRGDQALEMLSGEGAAWMDTLEENFQLRRYLFDSRLRAARSFSELSFDGRASAMASALATLDERFEGRPVAGILLVSDGNATDVIDGEMDWSRLPPVYPVMMGAGGPGKDLAIVKVAVTQTAFEDAPVTIQADVSASGYGGAEVVVQLFPLDHRSADPSGDAGPLMELTQRAVEGVDVLTYRFQIRPVRPGIAFFRLRVSAKEELGQFKPEGLSVEATLANNERVVLVNRGEGPYRILFAAGRPNWEYKFLNRAVAEDEEIQLVGLVRVANREPKFDFKGRSGESSNPLFRGFDRKTEDTERYDQPVFVRLNTRDELELRDGFPKTAEELYGYDAVILDDVEVEFFSSDQRMLLQKFVSERGGGFLMLGGLESFHEGKYHRTPIGDMLPVYVDRDFEKPPGEVRLEFTREGWLQPWLRLRSTEVEERARLDELPPFGVLNQVRGIKPGATVMARVTDSGGANHPAVVVQRFGRGRAGAVLLGDLWHAGLKNESVAEDLGKSWRQMLRWLVADVPARIELETREDRTDPNRAVVLEARVVDKEFRPLDNAEVTFRVRSLGAGTEAVRIMGEPAVTEAGLYQSTYIPRQTGGYHVEAVVTNAVGAEVGRGESGWTTDLAADEFQSLTPNLALLESIAKRTGGAMLTAADLLRFSEELPHTEVPVKEDWTFPLWHQPLVFIFALACFVAEWGLRRWKGLV